MDVNHFQMSIYLQEIEFIGTPLPTLLSISEMMQCQLKFQSNLQHRHMHVPVPNEKKQCNWCESNFYFAMALNALGVVCEAIEIPTRQHVVCQHYINQIHTTLCFGLDGQTQSYWIDWTTSNVHACKINPITKPPFQLIRRSSAEARAFR